MSEILAVSAGAYFLDFHLPNVSDKRSRNYSDASLIIGILIPVNMLMYSANGYAKTTGADVIMLRRFCSADLSSIRFMSKIGF
jgi:hypothetical protein